MKPRFTSQWGMPRHLAFFDDAAVAGGGDTTDYKALHEALQAKLTLETENFNKRFGGLQQTLQAEQTAHKTTKELLTGVQENLTGLQTTKDTLENQLKALTTERDEFSTKFTSTEADLKRVRLVIEKFPALADFESKNLLPKVEDLAQAETVYANFQASIETLAKNASTQQRKGEVPELPIKKDEALARSKELKQQATDHALHGREKEYNETMDLYHKAVEEEQAKK